MRTRAVLSGLLGLGLFALAGPANAQDSDYQVSREVSVRALDAGQQQKYRALLAMLRKRGGALPNEVRSGPQVGENVSGAFAALFLNGIPEHVGKQCCPV